MRLILSIFTVLVSAIVLCGVEQTANIPKPNGYELDRIVGNQLEEPLRAKWKAPEPQKINLVIYSASLPPLDEAMMRGVATHFGLTGQLEQIKGDTMGHIGFEISEPNSAEPLKSRSLAYWITMGSFGYSGGGDGLRRDSNNKPMAKGVPTKDEAKQKAIELLPLLGLSTNDLARHPDGRLKTASGTSTIGYTIRSTMERKIAITEQRICFFQKIPFGGASEGVGDGGEITFGFGSEGKVSRIEWCFRKLEKVGEAKPKTSKEIIRDLKNRNAWTWQETVPSSLTITNCVLAYPQGNSWLNQKYVWPFYMLTGSSGEKTITIVVPLEY